MRLFPHDKLQKIRGFFERSGILFPKGKRSGTDRRFEGGLYDVSLDDYLATEGTDRQNNFVMRSLLDRREERVTTNPLDGML